MEASVLRVGGDSPDDSIGAFAQPGQGDVREIFFDQGRSLGRRGH